MIALFILLPLLEGLMRMWRKRTRRPQNGRADEHVAQAPPPLPPAPHTPERLVPREGIRAREQRPDVPVFREASQRSHERAGRDWARRWIGPALDLRRAIVLTTIR